MNSIWTEGMGLPHFEALEGNVKTDVLIIGGGMAGILCAYFLQERGVRYILAEGRTLCSGITKDTTAKITAQHGLVYAKLLKSMGEEKAKTYLQANQKAVEKYYELCRDMDCDFERKTAYVYSLNNRKKLEQEAEALFRLGATPQITEPEELPFSTAGALGVEKQAQFHPLKFVSHICRNLNIYEDTFVKELAEHTAVTDRGRITFDKLIIATHFPIDNKHGMYYLKMYQHRSYVIALEHAARLDGMYVDEAKGGMSFRNYQEHLLIGGGSHRTGKKGGCWLELRKFARKYYPGSVETAYWATQDCMTLDGIPYIGPYSRNMPGCFVATGFHKWGMTSSMVAAAILADLVMEKENSYAEVFSPSRSMLKPQLFLNGCEAIVNLLTPTNKRCPHLGCALKWNEVEHTWDCPCHGSRFGEAGGLIDNPANGDWKGLNSRH